ncbi:MFS transporter [Nocardiopsis tropica]|jgi:MHS family proline/betaine transporter-like MFS transporter|uniref:MFS transporter n=1 Tax=Nocardiopsis tropica TaxID=109330 RepID=A0ABU7KIV7_9ACTN|nr:MFS transporter [Nocardiopsis umidischolae]MEE2049235.1 MFS transporter [Nocardiopsis umidischolae]
MPLDHRSADGPGTTHADGGFQSRVKVIRAAVIGTVVEYYDFGIYGYMATFVAMLFFVSEDPTAALLGTFAAFAVAFFMRVPGGILFGHIGDRYGRKRALSWTILLMVAATALIGLLPTYFTLGVWATALLVLCRCVQGFAAGGELGGANAFVAESAPARWRATQTSLVNSGTYLGSLFAALVALAATSLFTEQQMLDWAWRIPFLLSLPIGVIGLYIRSHLDDTPQFKELADQGETKKVPVKTLLVTNWRSVLKIIGLGAVITGGYYIVSVYAATYLQTTAGHSSQLAFASTAVAMVVGAATLPLSGYLADTIGRKKVILIGSVGATLLGFPMFMMMAAGPAWAAVVGQSVLFVCVSVVNGASFVTYAEMLSASTRYSGIALGNNVTNTVLGGTAPFVATWLIGATGHSLAPAAYFVLTALITLVTVFFVAETRGAELRVD